MRTTLAEAKSLDSGIAQSININACDSRFVAILNRAQRKLSESGKWWGTYRRMYVCATRNCIVWPREVAAIEGINLRGEGIPIVNEWYEFGTAIRSPAQCDCSGDNVSYDRGNVCQYAQFPWDEQTIRIYPTVAADAGAKVVLQGLDTNGVPIRTSVSGTYIDGEQVTLASPFATSAFTFTGTGLTGVQKPVTKGRLNVYALNADTGDEVKIAIWEPSERNPSYRRTYLPGAASSSCGGTVASTQACDVNGCDPAPEPTCGGQQFEAIVRMEFIPALVDTDWLFISNLEALREGMKSIVRRDQNQYAEAGACLAEAVKMLRSELDKYDPTDRININVQPHGTALPSRIFCGFR